MKGNRVIGATDDVQFALPLDPKTLLANKEKGIRVRPEHIHEALRNFAGISSHAYSEKFPLGVKIEEQLQGFWG